MQEQLEQIKNIEAAIEAILYAAGHPVEYDRIAEVLGGFLLESDVFVRKDSDEAFKWYMEAAKQNDADSQFNVAHMYSVGEGVEQSYERAMEWFLKSADNGSTGAVFRLACAYRDGTGVEQSNDIALELFLKAGDLGHEKAWKELAHIYSEGIGVEPDEEEAAKWMERYK